MAKKVIKEVYNDVKCPVMLTKNKLYDYLLNSDVNYKKLDFQLAMLMHEKTNGFIIGSLYKNKIDSFIIGSYEIDQSTNKKWCIIRYYKGTDLIGFESYAIKQMFNQMKKAAKEHNCNFIGLPNSFIYEYDVLVYNLKEVSFMRCFIGITNIDNNVETIGLCKEILDVEDELTEEEIIEFYMKNADKKRQNIRKDEEIFIKYNDENDAKLLKKIHSLDERK